MQFFKSREWTVTVCWEVLVQIGSFFSVSFVGPFLQSQILVSQQLHSNFNKSVLFLFFLLHASRFILFKFLSDEFFSSPHLIQLSKFGGTLCSDVMRQTKHVHNTQVGHKCTNLRPSTSAATLMAIWCHKCWVVIVIPIIVTFVRGAGLHTWLYPATSPARKECRNCHVGYHAVLWLLAVLEGLAGMWAGYGQPNQRQVPIGLPGAPQLIILHFVMVLAQADSQRAN